MLTALGVGRNEPYRTRRALLESLYVNGDRWQTTPAFDDGEAQGG
jgi:hypothetical protein